MSRWSRLHIVAWSDLGAWRGSYSMYDAQYSILNALYSMLYIICYILNALFYILDMINSKAMIACHQCNEGPTIRIMLEETSIIKTHS